VSSAILFTHSHADHICGLDDIRRYSQMQRSTLPCATAAPRRFPDLRRVFFVYLHAGPAGRRREDRALPLGGAFSLSAASRSSRPVMHGRLPVLGFRIGAFAYLTDCNFIPDESWRLLAGVKTVILDALRHRPHSTHFSVSEAVDVVSRLGAERAYFTHISHDLGHAETCAHLPPGVELAYDGQVIEIPG
jgi:phosphoribosyl 1,2-cyclic phosphate phosphodiesterase